MRTLTKTLISLLLAVSPCFGQRQTFFAQNTPGLTLSPGWTVLQDIHLSSCSAGNSGCSTTMLSTTAGSVWIVAVTTGNNVTISSITLSSGTWNTCSCHTFVTGNGGIDAVYNLTGTAGSTTLTVNLSGASSGFFNEEFVEILPPSGFTASLDTSGTAQSSSCLTTCPTVGLTLSGTDAVVQLNVAYQVVSLSGWNSFGSPYIVDGLGSGVAMNVNSAPATTFALQSTSWMAVAGLAFRSTAGTFTTPTNFSLVNYSSTYQSNSGGSLTTCNPTCNITINSTGSGNLLYLQNASADGRVISSVSDGSNTWVVPTGANTCSQSSGTNGISCAYALSSVSGVTTITVTMGGNGSNNGFDIYEVSRTSGTFALDAQGSAARAASTRPLGQSLGSSCSGCSGAITGTNDAIFVAMSASGGPGGVQYFLQAYNNKGSNSFAGGNTFVINYANTGSLFNSTNVAAEIWANDPNNASVVNKVAFK
jgi:hypothetical protein